VERRPSRTYFFGHTGFEIIDCPYRDWQFQPADFVAAFGLHLRLVVGQPLQVDSAMVSALVDGLAGFSQASVCAFPRMDSSSRKAPEEIACAVQP
jgi:hypothetical protein